MNRKLHVMAMDAVGANAGPGPWNADLHNIENQYLKNRGDFFVVLIDKNIIGMGGLRKKLDHQAEIKRMRVHPDHQKRGIGQKILNLLEQTAKELGYTSIFLDTTAQQVVAQNFYRKNGYKEIGKKPFQTEIGKFDLILYEKQIL